TCSRVHSDYSRDYIGLQGNILKASTEIDSQVIVEETYSEAKPVSYHANHIPIRNNRNSNMGLLSDAVKRVYSSGYGQ
ncbi:MAG: hypothetical protein ACFFDR_03915, partial [Candidatus Thorarchaeota archaeon]